MSRLPILNRRVFLGLAGAMPLAAGLIMAWKLASPFPAPVVKQDAAPEPQAETPSTPIALPEAQGFAESIGIRIIPLPEGEFQMGANKTDPFAMPTQVPWHRVRIPAGRGLSAHEITIAQFRRFVQDTGYQTEAERNPLGGIGVGEHGKFLRDPRFNWTNPGFEQSDSQPVVNVSWNDATSFCRWLTEKDGRTYRLPTEAEWEYACRGGTQAPFVYGDDPYKLFHVANIADAAFKRAIPSRDTATLAVDDAYAYTAPVGKFRPNPWAFHDMIGNVWEWCQDYFDINYFKSSPELDPQGPEKGAGHVTRGGGWESGIEQCTVSSRSGVVTNGMGNWLGFRVARVAAEP